MTHKLAQPNLASFTPSRRILAPDTPVKTLVALFRGLSKKSSFQLVSYHTHIPPHGFTNMFKNGAPMFFYQNSVNARRI